MARPARVRSVEESIDSFRASFRRMSVPETDIKVTWDTAALWARVRFVVPGTEPRRVVEHVERHAADTLVALWACARWLDERSRRVKRGETFAAAFEGSVLGKGG